MPNIVEISDFTGEFQLQQDNFTEAKFDQVRDEWTNQYIYQLLGAELGDLFLADLDANGVPTTARFTALYTAFVDDSNGGIVQSKGLKEYVKGIVWYYYVRQNVFVASIGGNKISQSQNSLNNTNPNFLVRMYNNAIVTGKSIQRYICNNSATYPEYNGQFLNYNTGL